MTRKGYDLSDYSDWFSCSASYSSKSPFTIYSDNVITSLSPLGGLPTQIFKLGFLSEHAGTITTVGELAGVTKTERLDLVANVVHKGTYTFDSITSISWSGASGTIVAYCYDSNGSPMEKDSWHTFDVAFQDGGSGYWNKAGVFTIPSATMYTVQDLPIGTQVKFDKTNIHDPTNGFLYILKNSQYAFDEDGLVPIITLQF